MTSSFKLEFFENILRRFNNPSFLTSPTALLVQIYGDNFESKKNCNQTCCYRYYLLKQLLAFHVKNPKLIYEMSVFYK